MNKNKGVKAVVIGGGIHGISSAIALGREGVDVTLVEKRKGLMEATSRATQNRAHLGYHYPRSPETAVECIKGLEFFKWLYPKSLFDISEDYYLIAKENSKTNVDEFKTFCDEVGLGYELEMPITTLFNEEKITGSFKVKEPVYNPHRLKEELLHEMELARIRVRKNSEVVGVESNGKVHKIITEENGTKKEYEGHIIVNATYAYSNNILEKMGLGKEDMTKYKLQTTEIVVARDQAEVPALTIMDGPFVTLLPFTNGLDDRLVLVYDVINSVVHEEEGYTFDDSRRYDSNWEKMLEHGQKYFPFFKNLEFIGSNWGSRPVPIESSKTDSRQTRLVSYENKPGLYSILEGKFISAPMRARDLVDKIRGDGLIR